VGNKEGNFGAADVKFSKETADKNENRQGVTRYQYTRYQLCQVSTLLLADLAYSVSNHSVTKVRNKIVISRYELVERRLCFIRQVSFIFRRHRTSCVGARSKGQQLT